MSTLLPTVRSERNATRPRVTAFQTILLVQGTYYALLGLWAILGADSFRSA